MYNNVYDIHTWVFAKTNPQSLSHWLVVGELVRCLVCVWYVCDWFGLFMCYVCVCLCGSVVVVCVVVVCCFVLL